MMDRKGFPESYDTRRLLKFLRDLKSGAAEVRAPVYSHVVYDIVAGEEIVVRQPDILILEGLNVLQVVDRRRPSSSATTSTSRSTSTPTRPTSGSGTSQRFFALRETVFQDPNSFFRHFAHLTDEEARADGRGDLARASTAATCSENILPTRERASLILRKEADHRVSEVRLHKL